MKKIILASTSPRRKEILEKVNLKFEIKESFYKEDLNLKMPPKKLVEYLSLGKAKAVEKECKEGIIIAADTIVVYKQKVLGKPFTEEKAKEMLTFLSGKKHEIITGVTIINKYTDTYISFHDSTKVIMKKLNSQTIDNYIATKEPLDKAGGYALQGIGSVLIEKIEGNFFNAMGLPVNKLYEELKKMGVDIL